MAVGAAGRVRHGPVRAVIFDWGGTLTPWRTVDFVEEARALAAAALEAGDDAHERLLAAVQKVWGRSRDDRTERDGGRHLRRGGAAPRRVDADGLPRVLGAAHLHRPGRAAAVQPLRVDGLKVGVLSNTVWPRAWHEEIFERDGVLELIDGAVYTSEVPWTKPSPQAFRAAMAAVGVDDPAACVFVGDRLFDDIWGAAGRHAHDPRPAQRHPARAGRTQRGATPTRWSSGSATSMTWSSAWRSSP